MLSSRRKPQAFQPAGLAFPRTGFNPASVSSDLTRKEATDVATTTVPSLVLYQGLFWNL